MSTRKTYHVTKRPDGNWQAKVAGADRASTVTTTKANAAAQAIAYAKNHDGNSSVIIHKQNGRIQEERTYPRSSDPRKTKG